MMKKFLLLLVLTIVTFTLFACKSSDFKVDGEFMAYEIGDNYGAPMITTVTVTIKDGKLTAYFIDTIESKKVQTAGADTPDNAADDKFVFTMNAKTKKELGDAYGMVNHGGAVAEWYVQAAEIEAFMLENGPEAITTNADGVIDNISANVTITDSSFSKLAIEAVALAKAGKFQAITWYEKETVPTAVMAAMTVDSKGVVSEVFLDVLEAKVSTDYKFTWNAKSKQELGPDYGLVAYAKSELEWFEQAALITDSVAKNGWTMNTTPEVAGVTIFIGEFTSTFDLLFKLAGDSVK